MASPMLLRLVEGEVLELTSSVSDVLPQDVASLVGLQVRELSTRGDGACALHAALGTLPECLATDLHLQHPRLFLRSTLGHPLQVIRSRVRPAQQNLVQTVLTTLWEFVLEYGADTHAARNEEALFLSHLRRSAHWNRVVEAIALHRERQEDFDVQDAIARQLSAGIFQRSLERRLWHRLTITAGAEEDYASPPWEVRNGQCVVKGTNERYAPDAGGPRSKYEALFDRRAVFDGLRVSYLRLTCGPRLVRLEDALGEYLGSDEDGC